MSYAESLKYVECQVFKIYSLQIMQILTTRTFIRVPEVDDIIKPLKLAITTVFVSNAATLIVRRPNLISLSLLR